MTDAPSPTSVDVDTRLANAGAAHHDAIQKLLQELRDKANAAQAAEAARVAAEAAKAEAETAKAEAESDKAKLAEYLEAVTADIQAEIDAVHAQGVAAVAQALAQ